MKVSAAGSRSLAIPSAAAQAIVALMRGVVYSDRDPKLWNAILNFRSAIRDYVRVIGLELFVEEGDGYAFLRQMSRDEDDLPEDERPAQLVPRRALGFPLTMLCVLMRKKLLESDVSGDSPRVIVERAELHEMMRVYMPPRVNEAKTQEEIDATIAKAAEFGFLRELTGQTHNFEIRRVIKALFTAEWLTTIDQRLAEYREYGKRAT